MAFGPPPLPVYEQPLCPDEGYIWTPGYWAYDDDYDDYYWVPGTWVMAPEVGFFWTPGYWGWEGEGFIFHEGYWGPQSVSTAGSIMVSVISAKATKADVGIMDTSSTTVP